MLSDDHLPALQLTIHTTTSTDLPAVLHALNTHHVATDFTADTTHPLTNLQTGHTYVTHAGADTAEHLATALITTAPNTAFELSGDPAETQDGLSIAYHPDTGLFRARCNADGTPLIPAEEVRHALTQAPHGMLVRTWLTLHAPALLGTHVRAALARTSAHPQHTFRHTHQTPDHGQDARCAACGTDIIWHYDDPETSTPYGHWLDSEYRNLCPATDEDADDPGHTPAPTPADFHQAALYLPPDPADRNHSFPVTALAGLRIGAYLDDTYTLNIGILNDTAHPALRTTPDGQLAVALRINSTPLHTPGTNLHPGPPATRIRFTARHPAETEGPEWTVLGVRWNESPEDVDALTVLPGTHEPAAHHVPDQLSGWVRHLRAPDADTALSLAQAFAATPEAVAAFHADNNT
ncbi:DUF3145 family protein [Streptomyces sp. BE147]|uniref:DUF3145 family protein n=1 Tax=Streptomyces sp. BE147 TaxID=3002524 RepID=UPI002E77D98A|nr:DUF3145 family protein [Streptomyces sp. BE147]MEE1736456.1 DUF3145 family protein [Streptomyces sp. BE147]